MPGNDGTKLEADFAEWMQSHLGYRRTAFRSHTKGKVSNRGYEVDIHGIKYPLFWDLCRIAGILGIVFTLTAISMPTEFAGPIARISTFFGSIDPSLGRYALGILAVSATVLGFLGKKRGTLHTWVECKDRKANVKRADIQKLIMSVEDVRALRESDWYPNNILVVTTSGFDVDALSFAREHAVICFKKVRDGFAEVR